MKRFFVALTLLTALSICLHSGYAQNELGVDDPPELVVDDQSVDDLPVEEVDVPEITPVHTRTAAVADAIVDALPHIGHAADVTTEDLAAITELTITTTSESALTLVMTDFEGLTGLTTLDLSSNLIISLPWGGVFDELTGLTTLDLSHNQMRTLPDGIFDQLTGLTTLDLSDNNQWLALSEGVFDNPTALTTLDLSHSIDPQSQIPEGIFDQLTALTTLNLSVNRISTLPEGIFDQLTALTTLDLSQNQFSTLSEGIFDQLTALTTLRLGSIPNIGLSDASIFDQLTALTTLELHDNGLTSLNAALFNQTTALTSLNLGSNGLSTLPENIFSSLSALETLHLNENQFETLPDGLFTGLESLETILLFANSGDPFTITISLEEVLADSGDNIFFKAKIAAGTPFDIQVALNVSGDGEIQGSEDLTISKGTTTSTDSVEVMPTGTGDITVSLGQFTYAPGSFELSVDRGDQLIIDRWSPTNALSVPEGTQNTAFDATITFSEPVNDFVQTDVSLTSNTANATITSWEASEDSTTYTATVTPTTSGDVSISVAEDVATDNAGNPNTASDTHTVNCDLIPPTVTLSQTALWYREAFDLTITFSEPVNDFVQTDVTLGDIVSGTGSPATVTITNWVASADSITYTATITPTGIGKVVISVPAGVATDNAGNRNTASASRALRFDTNQPTVSVAVPETIQATSFDVTITFNEFVNDFVQTDVSLTGSTATASITNWVALSQWNYTATVTPTASGDVSISVPADVATDVFGNLNTASTTHTVTVDLSNPTATVSVPSGAQVSTFDATISFSKPVTDFLADDILIAGTATASVTNVGAAAQDGMG